MKSVFFLGNYINKVDSKGRVSLPSNFRNALKNSGEGDSLEICLMIAFSSNYLKGGAEPWIKSMIDDVHGYKLSPEQARSKRAATGSMSLFSVDNTGRFLLSSEFRDAASLENEAMFIGMGGFFEIWNVEKGKEELEKARSIEMSKGGLA